MEYTRRELCDSLLYWGDKFGIRKNIKTLLDFHAGYDEISSIIIEKMFLNKISISNMTADDKNAYDVIWTYLTELRTQGYVNFK